ncbi:MAG TPA: efflux RND transporter periplasmic adaptor subunit [Bryobacteraceae bacterium]|nr:efflux RND transporter periplasmic adaptor subunit [Bryobacteraceae bacterium]
MKTTFLFIGLTLLTMISSGCHAVQAGDTAAKEAPPAVKVQPDIDITLFAVDHPEQFPLAEATEHSSSPELVVTGTVSPDVSRSVPVVSLASGRVTAIHARLGDTVKAGQLLLSIRSDDVSNGFADYRKAVRDEVLARTQLDRAKDLHEHGAMSLADLQTAEDTEDKAKIDVETTEEHLRLLGNNPTKPNGIVDVVAPVSGVITDQQVTNAAGVQGLGSTPFTISDLSSVWIICDVYENDLASVHLGDQAEIRLNAYPGQVFRGRVSNIGTILDPQIRTAKVRIEMPNPGTMRMGMFVTATFRGQTREMHTAVPASAVVHIHDRDFVYEPAPGNKFRRVEVVSGDALPGDLLEVRSGLPVGRQVVSNALVLDHSISQ